MFELLATYVFLVEEIRDMILIDCDDVRIEHEIRNKKSDSSGRSNANKDPHEVRKPVEINTDIIT